KFSGINHSERITITERGETIQALDSFNSSTHQLSYHITKGAPSIAKHASSTWSLNRIKDNRTTVVLDFNLRTKGLLGFLLTALIKKGMGKRTMEIAEDLKHYMEEGKPHP